MALTWDISKIDNYKELCFIPDPDPKAKPDDVHLNPVTDVLIWSTISVGFSEITEKNYGDFYRRLYALEHAGITFLRKSEDGEETNRNPNLYEVYIHIGLKTNATKKGEKAFCKFLGEGLMDRNRYEINEEIKEFKKDVKNPEELVSA